MLPHALSYRLHLLPTYLYAMNISYNWLRDYLPFDLTPDEVAAALTSIGLETGSVETVQSVRGGLAGLVTGRVLTCTAPIRTICT